MADDVTRARDALALAGITPSDEELAALEAIHALTRRQVERLCAVEEARYEDPGVMFRARADP